MGNFIIRASHVGITTTSGSGYPRPASDDEMEIAKRAARVTQIRWREEKEQLSSKPKNKQKNKKTEANSVATKPKPARPIKGEKLCPSSTVRKALKGYKKGNLEDETSASNSHQTTEAARKLGISDSELARRIAALRAWHGHDSEVQ